MLLYHSAIFPAPSCFSEYTLTDMKLSHRHAHQSAPANIREQLFSDVFTKTFCSRNVFIRTLGSHRPQPAKRQKFVLLFFSLEVEFVCLQRFPCHLCTHYTYVCVVSPRVWNDSYNNVSRCRVSVTHSLAIVWITRLYLNCSRPLIPKKWFGHSDPNTML